MTVPVRMMAETITQANWIAYGSINGGDFNSPRGYALSRPHRQVFVQVRGHQLAQVQRRIGAFADAVRTAGIGHHRERLVVTDQLVDERLRSLIVAVVIAGSMHKQQVSF